MKKITILDYGLGNLMSVKRAIEFNGFDSEISSLKADIDDSSHLIIPGVGSFQDAINALNQKFLIESIINHAKKGLPILGICLGMQLLADKSTEGGLNDGLGLISGKVEKLPQIDLLTNTLLKVPNIGWSKVTSDPNQKSIIFDSETNEREYYHVHSYHFMPEKIENIIGLSKFGNLDIVVAVQSGNIFGTQFHPEKSGKNGLRLLKKFLSIKV